MVQSLARGIEILSIIQERGSATIVEVASVLGVDKSTVSRLMATLMHYDMVSIDRSVRNTGWDFGICTSAKELKKISMWLL